jgi:hypothetical protein
MKTCHKNIVHKRIHRFSWKIIGSAFSAFLRRTQKIFIPRDNKGLPELTPSRYTHCSVSYQVFQCPQRKEYCKWSESPMLFQYLPRLYF